MTNSAEQRYRIRDRNEYADAIDRQADPFDLVMKPNRIILSVKKDPIVAD